jgi:hypothetical protein
VARISAKSAGLLVDEFDFSGISNSMTLNFAESPVDVTAFADTDMTFIQGKPSFTFDVNGLWSTASPAYDGEMFTDLTATARRVGIYPGGLTEGNVGYEGATLISASPRVSTVGDVIACNVTWNGASAPFRGRIIEANTITCNGSTVVANGTGYNLGTIAATNTMIGVWRMVELGGSGTNTIALEIQSETNNTWGSPTTQINFGTVTQSTGASGAIITTTGTGPAASESWWRVKIQSSGTGSRTFKNYVSFGYFVT